MPAKDFLLTKDEFAKLYRVMRDPRKRVTFLRYAKSMVERFLREYRLEQTKTEVKEEDAKKMRVALKHLEEISS